MVVCKCTSFLFHGLLNQNLLVIFWKSLNTLVAEPLAMNNIWASWEDLVRVYSAQYDLLCSLPVFAYLMFITSCNTQFYPHFMYEKTEALHWHLQDQIHWKLQSQLPNINAKGWIVKVKFRASIACLLSPCLLP